MFFSLRHEFFTDWINILCRRVVSCETPKFYGEKYKSKLNAGAQVISLTEWCPHYYKLGTMVAK
eukprot:Pgem_evm1s1959